jgi:hypothetical protein
LTPTHDKDGLAWAGLHQNNIPRPVALEEVDRHMLPAPSSAGKGRAMQGPMSVAGGVWRQKWYQNVNHRGIGPSKQQLLNVFLGVSHMMDL